MSEHEVTLGEVYRALKRQDSVLDEIKVEVKKTNGTVGKHETRISLLEAASDATARATADAAARAAADSVPIKTRTGLTLTLTGGGAVALWEFIKRFLGWG